MWQSLATFGFSSINLGVTILGGYFVGVLLEKNLHWKNMPLFGVLVGLALGLLELFIMIYKAGTKK